MKKGAGMDEDVKVLHSMGYAQELARRMGGFQNFAISFSIICILAGGITAFPNGFSAAGGGSIGIGWPLGSAFALLVAAAMGQIASAYPTAGGIYHWASIMGGKGWGYAAAWFNLLGLLFVVSSVNYGVYLLFRDLFWHGVLGNDVSNWGHGHLVAAILIITVSQAILNHIGIRATTILTDFSGYLIFVVATVLTVALIAYAPSIDFSRLFTFTNYTGDAGGGVWPQSTSMMFAFGVGLILVCYTITGFDASAHTSEETRNAAREVPKGMLRSVFWSFLFGYLMVCAFVLSMPSVDEGAKQGFGVFPWLMDKSAMPVALKNALFVGIVVANYLCALAGLTSTSRMMFAFARDGGFPAISPWMRHVSHRHRTPVNAIWFGAALCILLAYVVEFSGGTSGQTFIALAAGCAVFLYISYLMPVLAGIFAEGRSWTHKGPFNLGGWSKVVAVLALIGGGVLVFIGIQPPNTIVGEFILGLIVLLVIVWWVLGERSRFQGPPMGDMIKMRQAEIAREEAQVMQPE
jgi:amino acid transporter